MNQFLPARRYASAGISRHRVSVCLYVCVCLSHAGIVSKRLNIGSRKQRHVIAHSFLTPTVVGWRPPFPLKFVLKVTHPFLTP